MIVSMTAFGRLEGAGDWGQASWEMKTVNHRYLEISIRLPDELRVLENRIREQISAKLKRGKIDCLLRYEADASSAGEITIDTELVNKLIDAADTLPASRYTPINPMDILRWPGVIIREAPDPDAIAGPLLTLLDETIDVLFETRRREGEKIHAMILERCETAANQVTHIRAQLPMLLDLIRDRIMTRAQELSVGLDRERLEQEMVLLTQKMDVAEELDRLEVHIEEVRHVMEDSPPVGRRLDFLMQEMNREANTLGSKAANIEVTNASVELKVLIEQMREQIQNIE
ncbi:MAG: YicC/YloC family endoribonuclease [Gammaproteobacteria bacterium]